METLLAIIKTQLDAVERAYEEECSYNYNSRRADYLQGFYSGLFKAYKDIKKIIDETT